MNEDSKNRIPVGNKVRTFEAQGLRSDQNGAEFARQASERMLARYKFAAEYFENIKVFFKDGFNSEPGDLVIFDFEDLQVTNSEEGTRDKPQKFYEILNRSINIKTGDIVLSLVDTNYEARERYGLISPSSLIASGSTTTEIIIQDSFGILYPGDEKRKWEDYIGLPIVVHNEDWSYQEETILNGFATNNRYKMLVDALSAPPAAGLIVDIPYYPDDTLKKTNRLYKLYHAHFSPRVTITAGVSVTEFTVGAGDIAKFFIGCFVQVHDTGFTVDSGEIEVIDIVGNNVIVASSLGFTPSAGYEVDFIGFADQDSSYRIYMINEKWKSIEGLSGYYEISNLGRVKSSDRTVSRNTKSKEVNFTRRGKIHNLTTDKLGYKRVNLLLNKKRYCKYIHVIVAQHFIDNPKNKKEVNHINFNKSDNRVENLEWVTKRENMCHYTQSTKPNKKVGVYFCKNKNRFIAKIQYRNKKFSLGSYKNECDAVMARHIGEYYINQFD